MIEMVFDVHVDLTGRVRKWGDVPQFCERIMKTLNFGLAQIIAIAMAFATTCLPAATLEEFKSNFYNGKITPERVDKFIQDHPSGTIQKLVIASEGGDFIAGIKLADWVRKNGLDVEVYLLCQSACANFIFPAGKKKIIGSGALVLWHGSIEQKKVRELHLKYQTILGNNYLSPSTLGTEERKFLDDNKVIVEALIKHRELQARFFDDIQVNEYITRLGQEPVHVGVDAWTTTVRVMEKFGIHNIEAPTNYGMPEYLRRLPTSSIHCGGKCVTFDLDEQGKAQRIGQ